MGITQEDIYWNAVAEMRNWNQNITSNYPFDANKFYAEMISSATIIVKNINNFKNTTLDDLAFHLEIASEKKKEWDLLNGCESVSKYVKPLSKERVKKMLTGNVKE